MPPSRQASQGKASQTAQKKKAATGSAAGKDKNQPSSSASGSVSLRKRKVNAENVAPASKKKPEAKQPAKQPAKKKLRTEPSPPVTRSSTRAASGIARRAPPVVKALEINFGPLRQTQSAGKGASGASTVKKESQTAASTNAKAKAKSTKTGPAAGAGSAAKGRVGVSSGVTTRSERARAASRTARQNAANRKLPLTDTARHLEELRANARQQASAGALLPSLRATELAREQAAQQQAFQQHQQVLASQAAFSNIRTQATDLLESLERAPHRNRLTMSDAVNVKTLVVLLRATVTDGRLHDALADAHRGCRALDALTSALAMRIGPEAANAATFAVKECILTCVIFLERWRQGAFSQQTAEQGVITATNNYLRQSASVLDNVVASVANVSVLHQVGGPAQQLSEGFAIQQNVQAYGQRQVHFFEQQGIVPPLEQQRQEQNVRRIQKRRDSGTGAGAGASAGARRSFAKEMPPPPPPPEPEITAEEEERMLADPNFL